MQAEQIENLGRAKRNVVVLALAQAVLGAQMPVNFVVSGLAGQNLGPNPCLATLPLSMFVLGSALSARPLAGFMQRHGRRAGFLLACGSATLGGSISFAGLWYNSFVLFCIGALLTGVYMAAQGFFRFAATDTAPPEFQSKAISYVLAAGLLSAIGGSLIVRETADLTPVPFLATYGVIVLLNLAGPILFAFLDIPKPVPPRADAPQGRSVRELMRVPDIAVAMICAMVAYALMNLVMTSAPLAVVGCGFATADAANIVSMHVIAMFLPSFFTGHLIVRFGAPRIMLVGVMVLAGASMVAMSGVALTQFYLALILLGLGWNFGYIGATALLTSSHRPEERARVQGLNDALVFGGVFLASLSSGGLMNCLGGDARSGWNAVNMASIPFLMLAGGVIIWLMLRVKPQLD